MDSQPKAHKRFNSWQMWGMLLLAPYVLVFAVFVIYPVLYGLWIARHPHIRREHEHAPHLPGVEAFVCFGL